MLHLNLWLIKLSRKIQLLRTPLQIDGSNSEKGQISVNFPSLLTLSLYISLSRLWGMIVMRQTLEKNNILRGKNNTRVYVYNCIRALSTIEISTRTPLWPRFTAKTLLTVAWNAGRRGKDSPLRARLKLTPSGGFRRDRDKASWMLRRDPHCNDAVLFIFSCRFCWIWRKITIHCLVAGVQVFVPIRGLDPDSIKVCSFYHHHRPWIVYTLCHTHT